MDWLRYQLSCCEFTIRQVMSVPKIKDTSLHNLQHVCFESYLNLSQTFTKNEKLVLSYLRQNIEEKWIFESIWYHLTLPKASYPLDQHENNIGNVVSGMQGQTLEFSPCFDHRHNRIDKLLIDISAILFWLSSYVASHHLAMAPQSGAKDQLYCTVYCKTLN